MSGNEHIARMEAPEIPPSRSSHHEDDAEVAVVGAGPVGLTLASMLSGYGIRTTVLDKAKGPADHSRAAVVHARTLETLEPLGVVDEMVAKGVVVPHFGVRDRDRRLLAIDFEDLPTTHPYTLMLPQDETERILHETLRRHGGEVQWGREVTAATQNAEGVELKVCSATHGEGRLRARYLIGCDGANSTVREASGIPFEGATYPQSFVLADVRMSWPLPEDEVQLFFSPEGLVVVAPLPGGRHRVVATVDEASPEPSLSDVQTLLDVRGPRNPTPSIEEIVWSSRFRVHHRVASRFRDGGVFLCGDAAHVHSPAGGQGMNTGIQDAVNLAWKLALVLREQAPTSLLDSYENERRPVAQDVVSTTDRLTRLATMRSPVTRRLRNILLAGAGLFERVPRRLAFNLAEIDIAYPNGWAVEGSAAVGRWTQEDRILTSMEPAFLLIVPAGEEERATSDAAKLPELPVRVIPGTGLAQITLVRPDGYVAGRCAPGEAARLLKLFSQALET